MMTGWQFRSWTRRDILMVLIAFAVMMILQFPFTFFLDTVLTDIRFLYAYFWAFPHGSNTLFCIIQASHSLATSYSILGLMGTNWSPCRLLLRLGGPTKSNRACLCFGLIPAYSSSNGLVSRYFSYETASREEASKGSASLAYSSSLPQSFLHSPSQHSSFIPQSMHHGSTWEPS